MTWIPVLDNKPEDLQQVLIFDDVDEYVIGYYHEAGGVFIGLLTVPGSARPAFGSPCLNRQYKNRRWFLICRPSETLII